MSTKARWAWIVVCLAFAVCGVIAYLCNKGQMDAAVLKRQLQADLPLGSARADVEQWYSAKGLQIHEFHNADGKNVGLMGTTIRWYPPAWDGEIRVTCFFDEEDKLTKYHVRWIPNTF